MKRMISLKLSQQTLDLLASISEQTGENRTAVIERLVREGKETMDRYPNSIYIIGATLHQVRDVEHLMIDAHDPLCYFSFEIPRRYSIRRDIVEAWKNGADAGYYTQELEDRLNACGLQVTVRAVHPDDEAAAEQH